MKRLISAFQQNKNDMESWTSKNTPLHRGFLCSVTRTGYLPADRSAKSANCFASGAAAAAPGGEEGRVDRCDPVAVPSAHVYLRACIAAGGDCRHELQQVLLQQLRQPATVFCSRLSSPPLLQPKVKASLHAVARSQKAASSIGKLPDLSGRGPVST